MLDLNQQQRRLQVTSFLPGKDNLMLIKITEESVKFIESKYIQKKYELTALHIITEETFTLHNISLRFNITIGQHLESKVKIQNDPNRQITTTTESSVP